MKETDTKTQTKVPSKGNRVVKAILNTIINILIVIVLITSVLIAVLSLTSKANNGVATIFGYSFHTIQSPSMEGGNPDYPGGDYKVGDLVIGKADVNENTAYAVGDIVSYKTINELDGKEALICHRIIDTNNRDGLMTYQTKGDANEAADQLEPVDYLQGNEIASICYNKDYHGAVLKGWGKVLDFIRQPTGFFFAVLLPMIIFFLYEIIRVVINAMNYRKAKEEEIKENAEAEKDEAVKVAVAAALAEKEASNTAPAEASDAPSGMTPEELEQFRQFQAFQKMQKAQQESTVNDTDTSEEE